MKRTIVLKPVEMTPEIMQNLEDKGLIIRLFPHRHDLEVKEGETKSESIYETDPKYGPHKLITVTVNRSNFDYFGSHEDNEEFLLIGDPATKPMYLVIALCDHASLNKKIDQDDVSSEDFVALRVKYNDPFVSFFTMKKDIPHGEVITSRNGNPPSFYVTEPCGMSLIGIDFGNNQISISD
jgi:hypothetical protein